MLGWDIYSTSNNNNIFKKYTLLSAISSIGVVEYKLYEQGGMTTERFIEFLDEFIVDEYRNHLIIVDNAGAHRREWIIIRNSIYTKNKCYWKLV